MKYRFRPETSDVSTMRTALGLLLVALAVPAGAQPAPPAPPVVSAGVASGPIAVDGLLDEPAWAEAGIIPDLVQQDPRPGEPTPYVTRIRILIGGDSLFLGVEALTPEPAGIFFQTLQRDAPQGGDDSVAFLFDTFGDGRTGYFFRVNAGGARQDGLVIGGELSSSTDWDGLWEAKTRRTAAGWTAEIRLSAKSLRFHPGRDSWRMNIERYVAKGRVTLRWAAASHDARLTDLGRFGELRGLAGLHQGLGIAVSPYTLGRTTHLAGAARQNEVDAGADLSYNLTPELGLVATVRTDFAETEVDDRQINLTRFPLFFPEKRPFFLEGSNLFSFAVGLEADFVPFYSRRVGLVGGRPIPLDAGLKVLGRAGRWSIAALDVETGDGPGAAATNLAATRITWDADSHLRLGFLGTLGDPNGSGDNHLAGFDAVWQTTTFRGDKNLSLSAWGARSGGDLGPGDPGGWGVRAEYPNDLWTFLLQVQEFGEALQPALGFLPRPGTRQYLGGAEYRPRPTATGPFPWARQFSFELYPTWIEGADGRLESWNLYTALFNVATHSGLHFQANWFPEYERLTEPFAVATGVEIPAGEYRFNRFRLQAETSRTYPFRLSQTVTFGTFFGGRLTEWDSTATWTAGPGRLRLELHALNDFGDLARGRFSERLWQLKTVYAFSPDLVLQVYPQYDSQAGILALNSRLRWTLAPGRDLFVVVNRDWRRSAPREPLTGESDQVVIKLRWTWLG